jgi:hypothetical protein
MHGLGGARQLQFLVRARRNLSRPSREPRRKSNAYGLGAARQLQFLVRARLQPCRKSSIFNAALAAEGMNSKFSNRLFSPTQPFHPSLSIRARAGLANSSCQTAISLVLYLLGTSVANSGALSRPQFLSPVVAKIAQFLCNVSPFRMNTCKSVSKQRTLTAFRMNTYEKQGVGVTRVRP